MDNNSTTNQKKFPYKLILFACLLEGCFLYLSSTQIINMEVYHKIPFWIAFLGTFITIIIPILVAYVRKLKHCNVVYWLSVIGAFVPLGLLLIIGTTLYSLLAERKWSWVKKIFSKNTNKSKKKNITKTNKSNKNISKVICLTVIFLLCIGCYCIKNYNEKKEELSLSLFDLCEKSHHEFMKEISQYATSPKALKNVNKFNDGWKKRCLCESESIFSLFVNPYSKLKFAEYIKKHYDNWETYYKEANPKLMAKYKNINYKCIHRNTTEKIYYDNGKLKVEMNWDDNGVLHQVCYDENGEKTWCSIILNDKK